MIRLRNKNGEIKPMPEDMGFIEICDTLGNVACAVYPDSHGFVHIVTADSKEAGRYAQIFKVNFSPIVNIPQELKE